MISIVTLISGVCLKEKTPSLHCDFLDVHLVQHLATNNCPPMEVLGCKDPHRSEVIMNAFENFFLLENALPAE